MSQDPNEEPRAPEQGHESPASVTAKPRPRRRYPCIAAVLSFLVPGLGHLYAGRPRAAVWFYVLMFMLSPVMALTGLQYSFAGYAALLLIELGTACFIMVHSAISASRAGRMVLMPYQRWYALVLVGVLGLSLCLASDFTLERKLLGVRAFKIPSASMMPNIMIGDHIVAGLGYYGPDGISRGDVVVFRDPKGGRHFFIKRVVALGGDTVAIRDKTLYVNGEIHTEPSAVFLDDEVQPASRSGRDNLGPITVPVDSVFVMGDNRDHSHDSRYWGPIEQDLLVGKALFIYWSWDAQKNAPRTGRIGVSVQ